MKKRSGNPKLASELLCLESKDQKLNLSQIKRPKLLQSKFVLNQETLIKLFFN